jgi:hypothetical protein
MRAGGEVRGPNQSINSPDVYPWKKPDGVEPQSVPEAKSKGAPEEKSDIGDKLKTVASLAGAGMVISPKGWPSLFKKVSEIMHPKAANADQNAIKAK